MCNPRLSLVAFVAFASVLGCGGAKDVAPEKRPRPVVVRALEETMPPDAALVTASVGSWKTEQVGFEVGGRVESVAEPNTEIEGRVFDKDGNLISEGTPIGRLESERYRLQVGRAKAEVTRAEQALVGANTELNESLPAQIAAAEASRNLAEIEYDRSQRLLKQNAGSQGEVDRDKSNLENAISQIKQLEASRTAKQADIESLKNALLQAEQTLRDAERDLEDCVLYSSFRGQIADISVVPGSVVNAGQAIATLQMMDPIKVEVEVSAEDSRRLQQNEHLPVTVTMPDGAPQTHNGYLYLIDPIADPQTRTFTLTLLVINEKLTAVDPEANVAITQDMWRLDFKFLPGSEKDMLFVAEDALLEDDDGHYLWQATNAGLHSPPPKDHKIKVRKLRVRLGGLRIPYLGNWVFQQVEVDDKEFDPSVNMVVGKLKVREGNAEEWDGDTVLLDSGGQWMLRPGDLVRVDLSGGEATSGYYVPMDALVREDGQAYLYTVSGSEADLVAKRMPVQLVDAVGRSKTSSLRRIEPLSGASFEGVRYVTKGAHYLIDGEKVNAVSASRSSGQ